MRVGIAAAFLLCLLAVGCDDSTTDNPVIPPGPRTFVFGVRGVPDSEGRFIAATSDSAVLAKLEAQLALPADQRNLHIHGPIARGSGDENLSWHWYFLPGEWDMVEISIELCDGTPQMVEDDVDRWVEEIGDFCPWGSYVQREL